MGRELGKVGPTGEMNGRLASPRAQKLALGEETPLLSVKLSVKPIFMRKNNKNSK
jgi:hypothetical protein